MNTLVVYDSQYGNTERIAQAIADTLRAFGQVQAVRVDPARPVELQGVDLLILGCPTQGFRPTPAMQSLLEKLSSQSLSGIAVACFDTRFRGWLWKSSAAPHMDRQLRAMRVEPIVPPESFFVKSMKKEGPCWLGRESEPPVGPGWCAKSTRHPNLISSRHDSRKGGVETQRLVPSGPVGTFAWHGSAGRPAGWVQCEGGVRRWLSCFIWVEHVIGLPSHRKSLPMCTAWKWE
jgi:flavodoxin